MLMSANLTVPSNQVVSTRAKNALRVPVIRSLGTSSIRTVTRSQSSIEPTRVQSLRAVGDAGCDDALTVVSRTAARSIVDYGAKSTASSGSNGASHDATVLSVLQNYSGLTQERLFNMLRNSGRFNENQSTLSFILNALTSQGRVQNESGTYRFVPATRGGGGRSPSPAPSGTAARKAPAAYNGASSGTGNGTSATDEVVVLSVLQNYSGLTQERLSGMLRSSGKSVKSSVSSVLNALVSQGKVQNDNGTFRYLTRAASPSAARTSSSTPARAVSPASRRPSTPVAGPSSGNGASASDEAVLLSILQNYSGLTQERLSSMLRSSGKSVSGSVSSLLSGLVSQGKVQNDNGTFRYLTRAASPSASRASSSTPSRPVSPTRPGASRPSAAPVGGSGTSANDEAIVISVLKNYSGLSLERLNSMLRSSGKSVKGNLSSVLSGLVQKGKLTQDRAGIYRM